MLLLFADPSVELAAKQLAVPPSPSLAPLSFSPDEDIDLAFTRLSASVTAAIESTSFLTLQRAAIERAKSAKMLSKANELVPIIKESQSFQNLCTTLADTPYWNFLDTRMMETMVAASNVSVAQMSLENYKEAFFGLTLQKAAPYFPVTVILKEDHTTINEVLDRDPRQMTIGDLHKHRFFLESEFFETGPDTLTYYRIKVGSVCIVWQIHVDNVHKAYSALQQKNSQFASQAITTLLISGTEVWKDLPFLWKGQEVKQIGPIIPLPDPIQQDSYTLTGGLEWAKHDVDKVAGIYRRINYSSPIKELVQWATFHPNIPGANSAFSNAWSFAVTNIFDEVVGAMLCYPLHLQVRDNLLTLVRIVPLLVGISAPQNQNLLFKEAIRQVNLNGFSQYLIYYLRRCVIKPVVSFVKWEFDFSSDCNPSLPYSPTTPGWRSMTSRDISSAMNLTNKYSSQFEIHQVFQSEKEFSYYFLCPEMKNYMRAYVVEDPVTGNITDVIGFKLEKGMDGKKLFAYITILVSTRSLVKCLLTDILACAKQADVDILRTCQFGLEKDVFEELQMTKIRAGCFYLLNYQYPEVYETQCCLFCY